MPLDTLLVDDSADFLRSIELALSRFPEVQVVGVALTGADGIAQAERLRPSVVFMDVAMPEMNGLEATRRLKLLRDPPYVVVLTLYDLPEYRAAALAAGADAYVAKRELDARLREVVETAARRTTGGDVAR